DLIRLGIQILEDEDGISRIDFVSGAKSRDNQRQAPPDQSSFRDTRAQDAVSLSRKTDGLLGLQQVYQCGAIVPVLALSNCGRHHGSVKRHNAAALDPVQKDGDITGSIDDFGVRANGIAVQPWDEMAAAVASPGAKYRGDVGTLEHLEELTDASFMRA